ncbi:MAG: protein kinase [Acidimicrobiia bacterium]|nr:protein kinase [Acidimicrobiia bacterium]MYC46278.1 protein kinase [Acidimicrobiia bacterium]
MTASAGDNSGRGRGGATAGQILKGRYRLLRSLAASSRTELWTARDEVLDRTVLVKLLRIAPGSAAVRERFRSEALAVARLAHPGIVAVYDTLLEPDVTGLVLEHVEATPLSRFLHEGAAVAVGEALSIALQLADALAVAHDHGVRHCNLSPDSVWLCGDQRIKITDFGTAWTMGEMAAGDLPVSAWAQEQADIRALAGVLRDCLVSGGDPDDLPEDLAAFIATTEARPANSRFGSIAEARAFLASVRGVSPSPELPRTDFPARPLEPPPAHPEPAPGPAGRPRRFPRALALALVAAAVVAALVVPALTGEGPPAPDPPLPAPPVITTRAPEALAVGEQPPPAVATDEGEKDEFDDEAATEAENEIEGTGDESPVPAADGSLPSGDTGVAIVDVRPVTFRSQAAGADDPDALRTLDGDPSTHWATPGLSAGDSTVAGVGLEFRLAEPTVVSQLAVTSDTAGWEAAVFVGAGGHERLSDWGPLVDQQVNTTGHMILGLAHQQAAAVLLWIPDPRAALTDEIRIAEVIISAVPDPAVR